MPEDSKESKAKKLAAARKKLKEYQTKDKRVAEQQEQLASSATSTATLSEKSDSELNLNGHGMEKEVETETEAVVAAAAITEAAATPPGATSQPAATETPPPADALTPKSFLAMPAAAATPPAVATPPAAIVAPTELSTNFFNAAPTFATPATNFSNASPAAQNELFDITPQSQPQLNTIQLLIAEKAQLNGELNKLRITCREKDLENEELRTQYEATGRRLAEQQERSVAQQTSSEQLRRMNAELQHKMSQTQAQCEDHVSHVAELKQQVSLAQSQVAQLEQQCKQQSNELELAKIRINQISDEACITQDNRVETLTQTQFMYEQQIRDLQAMVQQLTQDKEQSNTQYQNYAQHLNAEVAMLKEKNAELSEETALLQEREAQLVQHTSALEREIQRNIARQGQLQQEKEEQKPTDEEIVKLKETIGDYEFERHEFQLKIKSQEDRLAAHVQELQQKQQHVEQLQQQLQDFGADMPDTRKLLATMESDKIAASRAVAQNVELKQQLDELEQRFVQLTNDKADLMNRLDAEEYANREMRTNYAQLEEKLRTSEERFKFKDEEMIRLSHENMDLTRKQLILQQRVDRLEHYEVREYSDNYPEDVEESALLEDKHDHDHHHDDHDHHDHHHDHQHSHDHHNHEHHNHEHHNHEHDDHQQDHTKHDHVENDQQNNKHDQHDHEHIDHDKAHDKHDHVHAKHDHEHAKHDHEHIEHDHEHAKHDHEHAKHDHAHTREQEQDHKHNEQQTTDEHCCGEEAKEQTAASRRARHTVPPPPPRIATHEANERLQQRFTALMAQVAELSDEKQRLEHLVLQLQGETETIGEYIALYQTQRRILKQREYEKAAQMQLLQAEREQMQQKITMLNQLVGSLGIAGGGCGAGVEQPRGIAQHLSSALAQNSADSEPIMGQTNDAEQQELQHQQQIVEPMLETTQLPTMESQEILNKIQTLITEIKENTKEIPLVATQTTDRLTCCSGKYEVV